MQVKLMPCMINFQVKDYLGDSHERITKSNLPDFTNRLATGVTSSKLSKSKWYQQHKNFETCHRS